MDIKYGFIATSTLLVGSVLILATINVQPADAKPQSAAPGQGPSGCNPGQSDDPLCAPPGQEPIGNPGQCQKDVQGPPNNYGKKEAHFHCHQEI